MNKYVSHHETCIILIFRFNSIIYYYFITTARKEKDFNLKILCYDMDKKQLAEKKRNKVTVAK
jgi:hypothetical protein